MECNGTNLVILGPGQDIHSDLASEMDEWCYSTVGSGYESSLKYSQEEPNGVHALRASSDGLQGRKDAPDDLDPYSQRTGASPGFHAARDLTIAPARNQLGLT